MFKKSFKSTNKMCQHGRSGSLHWFHWLIVGLSLVLTLFAWYFSQQQVEDKRQLQFKRESEQVIELIKERMKSYEDALWAGVATIQANGGDITFKRWRIYVDNLNLIQKYPGINGLGVIHFVQPHNLKTYLAEQRQHRPDYVLHPAHQRNVYLPISYIVPVKGNEKAVGLDMAHETNRFTAAMKAAATGKAQITGEITLVQDKEKTPGFLFYAPFYRNNLTSTSELRRKNFEGLVYAPFIVKKLLSGVLAQQQRHVLLRIKDGEKVLYDEYTQDGDPQMATDYQLQEQIPVYGRIWTIKIWGSPSFRETVSNTQPLTILLGGIVIDTLLLLLFITISRSNRHALNYADAMTEEIEFKAKKLVSANYELESTKAKLEKMAHFDMITQLPNRHSFIEYLVQSLARANHSNTLLAVCFLDLDNFKAVNDNMGHNHGDMLLEIIPKLLQPKLRHVDYLARLSGDEFGLILESVVSPSAVSMIVQNYIEAFDEVIKVGNYEIKTSVSIGIAMYPIAGQDPETLIKHADIAMYKAKNLGKNTFAFFDEKTNEQVQRRHQIEVGLREALQQDQFHLVYQPQIIATSRAIYGIETLIRWIHPVFGQLSPAEFIPIAEECGLIDELGTWVLNQVGRDYDQLKTLCEQLEISINVSVRQLEHVNFANTISTMLKAYDIEAKRLVFEVTETAIMQHPEQIVKVMTHLAGFGIRFALDDFGTGYSSMGYLKQLPISYIKIDQGFVGDIEIDPSDAAIVKAIIDMSHSLGVKTIAEGVETEGQYQFLKEHHCAYLQGYYFDRPMTLSQLLKGKL